MAIRYVPREEVRAPAKPAIPPAPVKPEGPKVPISIRLDADIVATLKSQGPGWQSRANALLRAALKL